jgi:hypothetical protein
MFSISAIAATASSADFAHQHRDFGEPRQLRGAPAPLAGDDFVAAGDLAHQDRLHQPLRANRVGQLLQRLAVHLGARLVFAGRQLRHLHHAQVALRRRGVVLAAQQRVEPASQSLKLGHLCSPRPCGLNACPSGCV